VVELTDVEAGVNVDVLIRRESGTWRLLVICMMSDSIGGGFGCWGEIV